MVRAAACHRGRLTAGQVPGVIASWWSDGGIGGPGRNRTGIRGFAVRCITTLPPDPRGAGGGLWFADAFWVKTRSAAERRIVWLRGWGLIPISASADWYARGVAWG